MLNLSQSLLLAAAIGLTAGAPHGVEAGPEKPPVCPYIQGCARPPIVSPADPAPNVP